MIEKIYCIGDSHVSFFSGQDRIQPLWPQKSENNINLFETFRIGPVLAHSLSHFGTSHKGREILFTLLDRQVPDEYRFIPKNNQVLMCFGEIDCRAHLLKISRNSGRSIEKTVKSAVSNYHDVLNEVEDLGYEVFVWNIIPSGFKDDIPNSVYPTYGSSLERNYVTKLYNEFLEEKCIESGKKFLNILNHLLDKNSFTVCKFYMDEIHLSQAAMPLAINELQKHLHSSVIKNKSILNFLKNVKIFK